MIAPQPFFEPRGTPISVFQRLKGLSELGYQVDLATYHVGEDVAIPGVNIIRARRVPFVDKVKVGPSVAKIPLDMLLFFKVFWLLLRNRYDVIHSHEEAAFFAVPLARIFRIPHMYDMHSSLPRQLANYNFGNYRPIVKLFELLENWVLKTCSVVLTIGADLENHVLLVNRRANHIRIENIALQSEMVYSEEEITSLKNKLGIAGKISIVYTGTFEAYQGIGMLLEGALRVSRRYPEAVFVLVGGKPEQVAHWQREAERMGAAENVVFTGIVSLDSSLVYLQMADILVSPRTEGLSVPLKLYSYLYSGKPIVATNIVAHTQILDEKTAVLVEPNPEAYAAGLLRLLDDPEIGARIGHNARAYAEKEFSRKNYLRKLERAYLAIIRGQRISEVAIPEKKSHSNPFAGRREDT